MKKLAIALVVLAPALAYAQPGPTRHHVHPVAAPSASAASSSASSLDERAAKEKEAAEEEGPPGDIKLWDTQILNNKQPPYAAMLFNFALLVLVFYRFGRKPLADGLKNRKISIASAIENAQKILSEAKQRAKKYRAKLEKKTEDAEDARQGQVSIGHGEADGLLRAADEKASRMARDATFILEQEKKQTQLDLVRETVEKAAKEAEELLRKNVSAADQERLAEEFLGKLLSDYEKGLPIGGGP